MGGVEVGAGADLICPGNPISWPVFYRSIRRSPFFVALELPLHEPPIDVC